jgi:hypothetical protein
MNDIQPSFTKLRFSITRFQGLNASPAAHGTPSHCSRIGFALAALAGCGGGGDSGPSSGTQRANPDANTNTNANTNANANANANTNTNTWIPRRLSTLAGARIRANQCREAERNAYRTTPGRRPQHAPAVRQPSPSAMTKKYLSKRR